MDNPCLCIFWKRSASKGDFADHGDIRHGWLLVAGAATDKPHPLPSPYATLVALAPKGAHKGMGLNRNPPKSTVRCLLHSGSWFEVHATTGWE